MPLKIGLLIAVTTLLVSCGTSVATVPTPLPTQTALPTPNAEATETQTAAKIYATQTASVPEHSSPPKAAATIAVTNTPTHSPAPTNTPQPVKPTITPSPSLEKGYGTTVFATSMVIQKQLSELDDILNGNVYQGINADILAKAHAIRFSLAVFSFSKIPPSMVELSRTVGSVVDDCDISMLAVTAWVTSQSPESLDALTTYRPSCDKGLSDLIRATQQYNHP